METIHSNHSDSSTIHHDQLAKLHIDCEKLSPHFDLRIINNNDIRETINIY